MDPFQGIVASASSGTTDRDGAGKGFNEDLDIDMIPKRHQGKVLRLLKFLKQVSELSWTDPANTETRFFTSPFRALTCHTDPLIVCVAYAYSRAELYTKPTFSLHSWI